MTIGARRLKMIMKLACYLIVGLALAARPAAGIELPIKDLTQVQDDHENVLTGLGLVTGLNGTGGQIAPTRQFLVNLMQRFGVPFDPVQRLALENNNRLTTDSMSVVVVTAKIRSSQQVNSKMNVTVSTLDGATDLNNGELLATLLRGLDNRVYAVASGRVTTGGILAAGAAATVQKNHPTTGYTTAVVKERVPNSYAAKGHFRLILRNPDYETASRIKEAINTEFAHTATIEDPGTVRVAIPPRHFADQVSYISRVQQLNVTPHVKARILINSQTGTVVVNDRVTLSQVLIAHGNITVITGESPEVSQPNPLSEGQTVVVPRTEIDVQEDRNPVAVIGEATTVTELAQTLNALSVSPQDLISIFRQLHELGSLHAELIIN